MKKKEIKKQTNAQLVKNLNNFNKDLFNLRFQKNNGQLKSPAKFREIKKNIARIKTIIRGKDA